LNNSEQSYKKPGMAHSHCFTLLFLNHCFAHSDNLQAAVGEKEVLSEELERLQVRHTKVVSDMQDTEHMWRSRWVACLTFSREPSLYFLCSGLTN
jgi:hypothetical protein